jgi:hypothetical protein
MDTDKGIDPLVLSSVFICVHFKPSEIHVAKESRVEVAQPIPAGIRMRGFRRLLLKQ